MATRAQPRMAPAPAARSGLGIAGRLAVGLLIWLGIGALAGGLALVAARDGSIMGFETAILAGSPFPDFLIPGPILGGFFGVGSLVVAVMGLRRHPFAPFLAFGIGCGQMIWIAVQLSIIDTISFLHLVMFLTGLGIAAASVAWGRPTFRAWRASA